jgi:hypothetical protein
MQAIRQVFPEAQYDLLINATGLAVVDGWSLFNHIFVDDDTLNFAEYDVVVLAEPRHDGRYMPAAQRAKRRVFRPDSPYRTRILRRRVKHEVQVNMENAYFLGYSGTIPALYINTAPDSTAFDRFRGKIGVHLGAAGAANRKWLRPRWEETIRKIGAADAFILGGCAETREAEEVCEAAGALNACGRFQISETARLIANSRVLICVDGGPMHIAAAVQTPVVALFGATRIEKSRPWAQPGRVFTVESPVPCSPCHYTPRYKTCAENCCMAAITAQDVLNAVAVISNNHVEQLKYVVISAGKTLFGVKTRSYDVIRYLYDRLQGLRRKSLSMPPDI